MLTNLKEKTREELKALAKKLKVDFARNISNEKLIELLEKADPEKASEDKMNKPSDGKTIKCIISSVDPQYPMNVCEVGVNGYFLSIPLDKEVEISTFFIPSIKATYWVKPILDEDGQVVRTEKKKRYMVEIV